MKNRKLKIKNRYFSPELEVIELRADDIITSSPGTETPSVEENDGVWDLDLGN
jgi:hypothetical protein